MIAVGKDHVVIISVRGGQDVIGNVASFDEQSVTVIEHHTGHIVTVPRADLVEVRVPTNIPVALDLKPHRVRHVGLQLFQGPGNVMLDFDYGHFYGYLATSIGYPIIFSGDQPQYAAAALGLGGTWRLSPRNNWQFDLMGTLTPTYWGGFSMGVGVSAGFHYTAPSGFTIGFKIPVFGVAPGCSDAVGEPTDGYSSDGTFKSNSTCKNKVSTGADMIANYYLQAAMTTPIISVGYRF